MQLSKTPLVNILFFLSVIGITVSVSFLWYSSDKAAYYKEPRYLAYTEQTGTIFNIHNTIYRTDQSGTLIEQLAYNELGLSESISDFAIIDNHLWVAEGDTHQIKICTIPLKECRVVIEIDQLTGIEAIDIAEIPDQKHLYVLSSGKHRLDKYTLQGEFLYTLKTDETLFYPNDVIALEDGYLIIADTNHHRVVLLRDNSHSSVEMIFEIPMKDIEGLNSNIWPTELALSKDHRLWVLNQDGLFENGDVLRFSKLDLQFLHSADSGSFNEYMSSVKIAKLPDERNPSVIESFGTGLLIGDRPTFSMLHVDGSAESYVSFGDQFVLEALSNVRTIRNSWKFQETIAQAAIAFFILLLIAAAIIEYIKTENKDELFTQTSTYEEAPEFTADKIIQPDHKGIIWLSPKQSVQKKLRNIGGSLGIGWLGLIVFTYYYFGIDDEILYIFGVMSVMVFSIGWMGVAASRQRIGVKDGHIWLIDAMQRKSSANATKVQFTGQRLVIGDVAVGIVDGHGKTFFDEAQFAQYVLPLLEQKTQVNEMQLYISKLKEGDTSAWLSVIGIVLSFLVLIWLYFGGNFTG